MQPSLVACGGHAKPATKMAGEQTAGKQAGVGFFTATIPKTSSTFPGLQREGRVLKTC
jgi:hypothetical protein